MCRVVNFGPSLHFFFFTEQAKDKTAHSAQMMQLLGEIQQMIERVIDCVERVLSDNTIPMERLDQIDDMTEEQVVRAL